MQESSLVIGLLAGVNLEVGLEQLIPTINGASLSKL